MALGLSRRRAPHAGRARKLQAEHAVRLVDCRSRPSTRSPRPGAVHVRSFDIGSSSTPVVYFCTVGLRSAAEARAVGIPGAGVLAYSMEGILPWVHAGGELVDAHGAATRRLHAFGAKYAAMAPASHEAVCFATRLSLFLHTLRAAADFCSCAACASIARSGSSCLRRAKAPLGRGA